MLPRSEIEPVLAISALLNAIGNALILIAGDPTQGGPLVGPTTFIALGALLAPGFLDGLFGEQLAEAQTNLQDLLGGPELGELTTGLAENLRTLNVFG